MSKPVKILALVVLIVWALAGTATSYIIYSNPRVETRIETVEVVKWKERREERRDVETTETFRGDGSLASRTTRDLTALTVDSNRDTDTRAESASLSEPVLPPAPRWNVVASYAPFTGRIRAGGGMNFGPVSVWVDNPVAVELAPVIGIMLRF